MASKQTSGPADSEALIVLDARQSGIAGTSRSTFRPFDIVPHPTPLDSRLLADASEPLVQWWGEDLLASDPPRVDGALYPALVQRPADASLWIRTTPQQLTPLSGASRQTACSAILRCRSVELLELVRTGNSDPAVLACCAECLAAGASGQGVDPRKAQGFRLQDGQVSVVLTDGDELAPEDFHARTLEPLLSACSDHAVVTALAESSYRPLQQAAQARLAELEASGAGPTKPGRKKKEQD